MTTSQHSLLFLIFLFAPKEDGNELVHVIVFFSSPKKDDDELMLIIIFFCFVFVH
jgi:hypothetical protein